MAITMLDNGYIFVPRGDWNARHSAGRKKMAKSRRKVFIHHTVSSVSDDPCVDMRGLENGLNVRGLAPGYSYVFHPSGVVLEGAGQMVGAHTEGLNSEGFGLSLIGNYDKSQPTLMQLVNMARTINLLRLDGSLVADLTKIEILGHRETKATACPGANLMNPVIDGRSALQWIRWFAAQGT